MIHRPLPASPLAAPLRRKRERSPAAVADPEYGLCAVYIEKVVQQAVDHTWTELGAGYPEAVYGAAMLRSIQKYGKPHGITAEEQPPIPVHFDGAVLPKHYVMPDLLVTAASQPDAPPSNSTTKKVVCVVELKLAPNTAQRGREAAVQLEKYVRQVQLFHGGRAKVMKALVCFAVGNNDGKHGPGAACRTYINWFDSLTQLSNAAGEERDYIVDYQGSRWEPVVDTHAAGRLCAWVSTLT